MLFSFYPLHLSKPNFSQQKWKAPQQATYVEVNGQPKIYTFFLLPTCLKLEFLKQVTGSGTITSSAAVDTRERSVCEARWISCDPSSAAVARSLFDPRLKTCVFGGERCREQTLMKPGGSGDKKDTLWDGAGRVSASITVVPS